MRGHLQVHDPEVEELGPTWIAVNEDDVARLDIAMNDASRVRRGEPFGDATRERQGAR
jgi:hypothetical protein